MKTTLIMTFAMTFIMALAIASPALAASSMSPQPIAVALSQPLVALVTVTNTYTGESIESYTGTDGGTVVEWANSEKGVIRGAKMRIETLGVVINFDWAGDQLYFFNVDVNTQATEKCIVRESLDYGATLSRVDSRCDISVRAPEAVVYLPVVCRVYDTSKTGETLVVQNDECDVRIEPAPITPVPPTQDIAILSVAITFILTLLGVGGYVKLTRKGYATVGFKIVSGKTYHSHKNASGYHNPDTVHDYQPHPKGQLEPKYSNVKNAEGKYDYKS